MKWLIIAWDQIRLNKKISGILISLIALSIFLVGVIAFYNNIYNYSEKQCEEVLNGTIDEIGLIYAENNSFYSQDAKDFMNDAVTTGIVRAMGSVSEMQTDRLPELAHIQNPDNDELTWLWVDETALNLCDLSFYESTETNAKSENVFHLYLGYNFRQVKAGTKYVFKDSSGESYTYVVDGILKKHQEFISDQIASGTAAGNTAATYDMDNRVMVFGDVYPPSGFWIYETGEHETMTTARNKLQQLADQHDLQLQFSTLDSYLENAHMENRKIQEIFQRMLGVILIGTLVINLSMCALSFVLNKKEYGVLYICGFSQKDLIVIYTVENLMKGVVALGIGGVCIYAMFTKLFVYSAETDQMIRDIFFHDIFELMIGDMFILVFALSILPVILVNKFTPQAIVKGGNL